MSIEAVNGQKEEEEEFLLQDEFSLYPGKGATVRATLYPDRVELAKVGRAGGAINGGTANGRSLRSNHHNHQQQPHHTVWLADCVGCECGRSRSSFAGGGNSKLSLPGLMTGKKADGSAAAAFLCLHAYPYSKPVASGGFRRKRDLKLRAGRFETHEQNLEVAQKWRLAILLLLRGVSVKNEGDIKASHLPATRKLLVLINPASGRRKGIQIFNKQVRPLFRDAELDCEVVVTAKQFQAREMGSVLDSKKWQGIVVVAGDGLVYEVLNGMMMHADPASVLKVPIGIIPAGSGNALFAAVIDKAGEQPHKCTPLHAAFLLCKGGSQPIDLVSIATPLRRIHSFLAITWGIIADIDIESERFRWLGKPRFTIGTVIRILNLRRYRGTLSFLPVADQAAYEHLKRPKAPKVPKQRGKRRGKQRGKEPMPRPHSMMDTSSAGAAAAAGIGVGPGEEEDGTPGLRRIQSLNADLSTLPSSDGLAFAEEFIKEGGGATESGPVQEDAAAAAAEDNLPSAPSQSNGDVRQESPPKSPSSPPPFRYLPKNLADPLPEGWTTVDGDFVGILITYLSHIGEDVNVWPERRFDEGVISIQYIHFPVSRRNLADFVTAIQTGRHLTLPFTHSVFVRAFRMVPRTRPGIITVDGEVIEYGPVQGEILEHKPHIIFPTDLPTPTAR